MLCPKCQFDNPADSKYCRNCGGVLSLSPLPMKASQTLSQEKLLGMVGLLLAAQTTILLLYRFCWPIVLRILYQVLGGFEILWPLAELFMFLLALAFSAIPLGISFYLQQKEWKNGLLWIGIINIVFTLILRFADFTEALEHLLHF